MKRGWYETDYGNTCFVSGPTARSAFDVDAAERVPLAMVDESTWRAEPDVSTSPEAEAHECDEEDDDGLR